MYTLFKVYGRTTLDVYYGYTRLVDDVKNAFLCGYRRSEMDRADSKFVEHLGGEENIMIEEIDIFETEIEAFEARNDIRANDPDSVTGPTFWPTSIAQRVEDENPIKMSNWKTQANIKKAKTAREAFRLGKWTNEQIQTLAKTKKQKRVVAEDLSKLTPKLFAIKYELTA